MIFITARAAEKVKELSDAESIGHYNIRAKIQGGGCAGFTYDLYFEDQVGELDETIEYEGIKVIIDPLSFQYMDETTIDWIDGPFGAGFKFLNPNVTGSCGCGSSVSF